MYFKVQSSFVCSSSFLDVWIIYLCRDIDHRSNPSLSRLKGLCLLFRLISFKNQNHQELRDFNVKLFNYGVYLRGTGRVCNFDSLQYVTELWGIKHLNHPSKFRKRKPLEAFRVVRTARIYISIACNMWPWVCKLIRKLSIRVYSNSIGDILLGWQ